MVQLWRFIRREQRPFSIFQHPLHKEVGDPVSRISVMGPSALISRIAFELKKVVDVIMPGLHVDTGRASSFTAAVNSRRGRI